MDGPIRMDCLPPALCSGSIPQLAEGHYHRSLGQRPPFYPLSFAPAALPPARELKLLLCARIAMSR